MIDEEISRIVRDSQRLADEILRKDIDILHHLAKELLKYETIDSKVLNKILRGEKLTRPLNESVKSTRSRRQKQRTQKSNPSSNRKTVSRNKDSKTVLTNHTRKI